MMAPLPKGFDAIVASEGEGCRGALVARLVDFLFRDCGAVASATVPAFSRAGR
jgi:hypothetical protein